MGSPYALGNSTTAFLGQPLDAITGFNRLHPLSATPNNLAVKTQFPRICAAATLVPVHPVSDQVLSINIDAGLALADEINDGKEFSDDRDVPDKLEEWIRGTVTEIVKNVTEAPLLIQIYANGEVKTNKAVKSKCWPNVLITEKSSSPADGIILVEELEENRDDEYCETEFKEEIRGTRVFGVLIQGKISRDQSKSACYLLKTSSVNGGGIGSCTCSHYCLMKVKNFTETASSQLKGCWLVN